MHILMLPSFLVTNNTGAPQGDELGRIYPFVEVLRFEASVLPILWGPCGMVSLRLVRCLGGDQCRILPLFTEVFLATLLETHP
jgi:hypothetical protein